MYNVRIGIYGLLASQAVIRFLPIVGHALREDMGAIKQI